MSAPADEVDWAAVERRTRRLGWLGLPLVPAWFAAIVLLTGDFGFWEGSGAWIAVAVAAAVALLGLLSGADWDHPVRAIPAALVLVGLVAAYTVLLRRLVDQSRRWVADPPGPAREQEPPTQLERWTRGRRLGLLARAFVVLGVIVGALVALLD
jgi:hypothetical protein